MIILNKDQKAAISTKLLKIDKNSDTDSVEYAVVPEAITKSKLFPKNAEVDVEKMTSRECHWNVKKLLIEENDPDAYFCTGWALHPVGTWINHSWIWVDDKDASGGGFIVDTIAPGMKYYFGVKLAHGAEKTLQLD